MSSYSSATGSGGEKKKQASSRTESYTAHCASEGPYLSDTISDEIIQDIFRRSLPHVSDSEEDVASGNDRPQSIESVESNHVFPFPVNYTQSGRPYSI